VTLVRIIDWHKRTGALTRWAGCWFEEAGCKVDVSFNQMNTGGAVDLVFTPIPGLRKLPKTADPSPTLVTQLEGMGHESFMPGSKASPRIEATLADSDKVLLADPNMYLGLKKAGVGDKLDNTLMVPNPAPPIDITLTDQASAMEQRFTVFYPSGAWYIKKPENMVRAARIVGKKEPSIRFVMITGPGGAWKWPLEWLDAENIEFLPHQEHRRMVQLYAEADIVCPWSAAEILPWTVFESFIAAKPTIVDCLGKTQSVNRKYVEEMCKDFGMSSKEFHEKWKDMYMTGNGDHFLHVGTPEELAQIILDLYKDEEGRAELSVNARRWIDQYWTCKDKGKKVLEIAGL